ncbi:MAG: hypothetical protein HQL95_00600 [Magnetococcales bacterium]|nr:hypothetical protein [Magnetococcales bacterium]
MATTAALTRRDLEKFLEDARNEPSWREEANKAAAYYDGDQLDQETLAKKQASGSAPVTRNLVAPMIDLMLGAQAKARQDWKVVAQDEESIDLAEALTHKMRDAERMSGADRACADAYASMVKTGIGWVEVAKETDPFKPAYRVQAIHRNEIWWDWRAKRPDLSDARFLFRKKFFDSDILEQTFPKHVDLIRRSMMGWSNWDPGKDDNPETWSAFNTVHSTSVPAQDWIDTQRKRLCLYEVWSRTWEIGFILRFEDGRVIELDEGNEHHLEAILSGQAEVEKGRLSRVWLSWWLGPHLLSVRPSPYQHNQFPYVPFWGFRKDKDGAPYGMISRMLSPQDIINFLLSKLMDFTGTQRIIADDDAFGFDMDIAKAGMELGRTDTLINLNPNRKNADAVKIVTEPQLTAQHAQVLKDATLGIQSVAGIHQEMMGKSGDANSGVAINSLIEQGTTTQAEINDNFLTGRRTTGELLLSLVRDKIGDRPIVVTIKRSGAKIPIQLNQMTTDEQGNPYRSNDVVNTQLKVDLEDIPASASVRQQQSRELGELIAKVPQLLQYVIDLVIKSSDLPYKDELVARLQTIIPGMQAAQQQSGPSPQDVAMQAQQQQMMQEAHDAKLAEQAAKIHKLNAEAATIRTRNDAEMASQFVQQPMRLSPNAISYSA